MEIYPTYCSLVGRLVGKAGPHCKRIVLKRTLGRSVLKYDELYTVLCDCESIINCRPLTYVSENPEELIPLTPSMFLISNKNSNIEDIEELNSNSLNKRIKYQSKLLKDLRQRCRNEYLSQLIQKHNEKESRDPQIGEVVLVGDDNKKRLFWALAKIIELVPGRNGKIRTVRLKTQHGKMLRPIQRIYPLEIRSNENLQRGLEESIPTVSETLSPDENTDIKQAFLQICLADEHKDAVRFLWSDDEPCVHKRPKLQVYRFNRVNFGVSSSPFLLAATIRYHIEKYKHEFPDTVELLDRNFYVDDLISGGNEFEEALQTSRRAKNIMEAAGMDLRKWITYDANLMEQWKKENFNVHPVHETLLRRQQKGIWRSPIYLRTRSRNGISVKLVTSKSRVAPLNCVTLPRLELLGALVAARLASKVKKIVNLKRSCLQYHWTDSKIVLFWIKGNKTLWKQFVANRVNEITSLTDPHSWYHCAGKENPADFLSRGLSADCLVSNSRWWTDSTTTVGISPKDGKGIVRVGGRLENAPVPYLHKHPAILPKGSKLSKLDFNSLHTRLFHVGPQGLLNAVRQKFWPLSGRSIARKTVHQCVTCFKKKADSFSLHKLWVEEILNSRPLTPLSSDADNFDVLTPGHFLIGRPITSIPEPNLIDVNENRLSRWEKITKVVQRTWKKWKSDYLNTLQARSKCITEKNDLMIGQMVLVKEDFLPINTWPLGRLID
ncbi:integrase catalytic domain-containing protein [Trichonephila clavipes]|nr:integrase catalytic domain-containing protein [Trichonephila clavipes]